LAADLRIACAYRRSTVARSASSILDFARQLSVMEARSLPRTEQEAQGLRLPLPPS
jgi:hypothetical protein